MAPQPSNPNPPQEPEPQEQPALTPEQMAAVQAEVQKIIAEQSDAREAEAETQEVIEREMNISEKDAEIIAHATITQLEKRGVFNEPPEEPAEVPPPSEPPASETPPPPAPPQPGVPDEEPQKRTWAERFRGSH